MTGFCAHTDVRQCVGQCEQGVRSDTETKDRLFQGIGGWECRNGMYRNVEFHPCTSRQTSGCARCMGTKALNLFLLLCPESSLGVNLELISSAFASLCFTIMNDARGRTRNTRQQMPNVPKSDKELLLHCLSRLHPWPLSTLFVPPTCCQSVSFRPSLASETLRIDIFM